MFWDIMTSRPETVHALLRTFSDQGTSDGYRHMNGYGSNTFKMVNATGNAVYVKFHYLVSSTTSLFSQFFSFKEYFMYLKYSCSDLYFL